MENRMYENEPDCENNCGYEEVTNGECECWNKKQDEQPGHPEFD